MSRVPSCPLYGAEAERCLLGPFPVWICPDEACSCAWGFWVTPAFWLADKLQPFDPEEPGWLLVVYEGSYWRALWASVIGRGA